MASFPAFAGDWTAVDLGQSVPLWYEYRASVNDAGTVAATTMTTSPVVPPATQPVRVATAFYKKATSAAEPLPGRTSADATWTQSFAQDLASEDRVVGFHATTNPAMRRASLWVKSGSWGLVDLHASVTAVPSFATYTISAAYGTSPEASGAHMVVGYAREKISPTSLSRPMLWQVGSSSTSVHSLPLPTGDTYGIAYGVSDSLDKANKRYACGGTGTAGSGGVNAAQGAFMGATCWDITNPSSPIAIEISQTRGSAFASSVVNRVRTLNLGPGSEGGSQTFAIGYAIQTNGAVVGFVKNLTTGAYDINTAVTGSADALLSDVALQRFAEPTRANVAGGPVYHGPMVVGGGTTSAGITYPPASQPSPIVGAVTPMRAIQQTRIAKSGANTAQTCNLNSELGSSYTVEMISGVSRNGLYMIGYDGGKLVLLKNTLLQREIKVFARNAVVYSSLTASTPVTYHWAEVWAGGARDSLAQIVWSDAAGCERLQTGLACHTNIGGTRDAQSTRRSGATPTVSATYIQGTVVAGGTCDVTPVYALADLTASMNPATNSTIPSGGAAEDWLDCSSLFTSPGENGRAGDQRLGNSVDVKRDFYHCGACGQQTDDGRVCTTDTCNSGTRTYTGSGNGCWIGGNSTVKGSGTCYLENERNPAATTTAYRLVDTRNDTCGNASTTPSLRDPCSACRAASNTTGWTTLANTLCCNATGGARLDAYDRQQTHCNDSQWSYDRNDGRVRGARWKDPRPGRGSDRWTYNQNDDWSDGETCLAFGSEDPHDINENTGAEYGSGYKRPRRIDAFFTPPVDMEDWYEAGFDDDGNGQPTPKPRARLIVRGNSGVQMQLCLYVDVRGGSRGQVNIKDMRDNAGVNRTTTQDGPVNSPAFDARGQCVDTDANGVADLVVYDYDNTKSWSDDEDAYVHFVVRPLGDVSSLHCDQLRYTLYYGNDKLSGRTARGGYRADDKGCVSCCN